MVYKIIKKGDRYYILTQTVITKGYLWFKRVEEAWVRADRKGKAVQLRKPNPIEGFESIDHAYDQVYQWQLF